MKKRVKAITKRFRLFNVELQVAKKLFILEFLKKLENVRGYEHQDSQYKTRRERLKSALYLRLKKLRVF